MRFFEKVWKYSGIRWHGPITDAVTAQVKSTRWLLSPEAVKHEEVSPLL